MRKDVIRSGLVLAVLLVLYNLIAFVIPFSKTGAFWAAYVFTLIAIVIVGIVLYIVFVKKPGVKSHFYGFPVARLGVIYGAVQLALGLAAMAMAAWIETWIVVIIFTFLLGAAVVGFVAAESVAETVVEMEEKQKTDVYMMRELDAEVRRLSLQCDVPQLAVLAEELKYSDPVSSEATAKLEDELIALIGELRQSVEDGKREHVDRLCCKASSLLAERNRICIQNKR